MNVSFERSNGERPAIYVAFHHTGVEGIYCAVAVQDGDRSEDVREAISAAKESVADGVARVFGYDGYERLRSP